MKKLICILLIAYCLSISNTYIFAQEEDITPTVAKKTIPVDKESPTPKSKIDEIKEKIASTVAQLNLVSKKAFIGEITKLEKNQLTIERRGEAKIVEVDELTAYTENAKAKKQEIAFEDLDVGDTIVAIGLYNKDSRRLLARFVLIKDIPLALSGAVREVDIKGGTIAVEDKRTGKKFIVDIETTTKTNNYTPQSGITKSGLSKIEIGQRAHVYGLPDSDEGDRMTALRVLLLPEKIAEISKPPEEEVPTTTKEETTPVPTKKPTATPKPKATPIPAEE